MLVEFLLRGYTKNWYTLWFRLLVVCHSSDLPLFPAFWVMDARQARLRQERLRVLVIDRNSRREHI